MTYIKLEDVHKILIKEKLEWEHSEFLSVVEEYVDDALDEINSLPSINPESMIESNKIQDGYTTGNTRDFEKGYNQALQELLQRFKS